MKILTLFKTFTLALGCAALAMTTIPAEARDIRAHAGTTFDLIPVEFDANGKPTKFTHTVDGVVRVSLLGNCTFHADVIAIPNPDGSFSLSGTFRITSAKGDISLDAEAGGVATPDPDNPAFVNFHYDVEFTGGTGLMKNAHGKGDVDGFAMFTSQSTGKATWLLHGHVGARNHKLDEE
jgi:hypothetical protein